VLMSHCPLRLIRVPILLILATAMVLLVAAATRADQAAGANPAPSAAPALTPEQAAAVRAALEGRLPPGTEIVIETKDGGTLVQDERAEGVGAGARARGTETNQAVTGSAPEAGLDGKGRAKGGDQRTDQSAVSPIPPNLFANPLLYAGILCGLGAGACFWPLPLGWKPAAVLGVLAAAFVVAAMLPAVLVWGLAVAGLVAAVAILAASHQAASSTSAASRASRLVEEAATAAERYKEALRAVVGGVAVVEQQEPLAVAKVKTAISAQADPEDRDVIRTVKREDGWA
jgi:hypothetical protein